MSQLVPSSSGYSENSLTPDLSKRQESLHHRAQALVLRFGASPSGELGKFESTVGIMRDGIQKVFIKKLHEKSPSRLNECEELLKSLYSIPHSPTTERMLNRAEKALAHTERYVKRLGSERSAIPPVFVTRFIGESSSQCQTIPSKQAEPLDIEKYSLLGRSVPKVGSRELAHILGDPYIGQSKWQGWGANSSLLVFLHHVAVMLRAVVLSSQEQEEVRRLLARLQTTLIPQNYQSVEKFQQDFEKRVSSLAPEESFFVSSGWMGRPGHKIYIEVVKNGENEFGVRVYNTGGGLENHPYIIDGGHKRFLPFLELGGISKESLCNGVFSKGIFVLETMTSSESNPDKIKYKPRDFYDALLGSLHGALKIPSAQELEAMSDRFYNDQTSGTCTYRALLAIAHVHLSEKLFQRLLYESGWRSLVGYYQAQSADSVLKDQQRALLRMCSENFMHGCLAAYQKGLLSFERLKYAYATTVDILRNMEHMGPCTSLSCDTQQEHREWVLPPAKIHQIALEDCPSPSQVHGGDIRFDRLPTLIDFPTSLHPDTVSDFLKDVYEKVREIERIDPNMAGLCWEKIVEMLPYPTKDGFWSQVPAASIPSCAQYICMLTELRLRLSCKRGQGESAQDRLMGVYFSSKCADIQEELLKIENPIPGFEVYHAQFTEWDRLPGRLGEEARRAWSCDSRGYSEWPEGEGTIGEFDDFVDPIIEFLKRNPERKSLLKSSNGESRVEMCAESYCDYEGKILPPSFCYWHRQAVATEYLRLKDGCDFPLSFSEGEIPFKAPTYLAKKKDKFRLIHEIDFCGRDRPAAFTSLSPNIDPLFEAHRALDKIEFETVEGSGGFRVVANDDSIVKLLRSGELPSLPLDGSEYREFLYALSPDSNGERTLAPFRILDFVSRFHSVVLEKKYQDLLLHMFDRGALLTAVRSDDYVASAKKVFENTMVLKSVRRSCFAVLLVEAISRAQIRNGQTPLFPFEELRATVNNLFALCQNDQERAFVHSTRATLFAKREDCVSDDVLKELLVSKAFLASYPLDSSLRDRDIEKFIVSHGVLIKQLLDSQGKDFASNLIEELTVGSVVPKACDTTSFPWCQCGAYHWHVFDGTIICGEQSALKCIPDSVREHPDFGALFANLNIPVTAYSNGKILKFNDIQLIRTESGLKIQKLIDGSWYEYVPKGKVPQKLRSSDILPLQQIMERTTQWIAVDSSEIVCLDLKESLPKYRMVLEEGKLAQVLDMHSGAALRPIEVGSSRPFSVLNTIEEVSNIFVWENRVELPRFGLACTIVEGKALLDSPKGFWVSDAQEFSGCQAFKKYLVIENDKHQRKVFIPKYEVNTCSLDSIVSDIELKQTAGFSLAQDFFLYDIDEEGGPYSKDREANLYLAYIAIASKQYEKCVALVAKYATADITPFSIQERLLFQWMADVICERYKDLDGGGPSPQAASCFLHIVAALLKNAAMFGWTKQLMDELFAHSEIKEVPPPRGHFNSMGSFIRTQYERYLSMRDDVSTTRLLPDQELMIQELFPENSEQAKSRREVLKGGEGSRFLCIPTELVDHGEPIQISKISVGESPEPFENPFRCGKAIVSSFGFYYQKARKGDLEALQDLVLSKAGKKYGDYVRLLLCVAEHPDSFPSFARVKKHYYDHEFLQRELVDKANEFFVSRKNTRHELAVVKASSREDRPKAITMAPLCASALNYREPLISQQSFYGYFRKISNGSEILSSTEERELLQAFDQGLPVFEEKINRLREEIRTGNCDAKDRYGMVGKETLESIKASLESEKGRSIEVIAKMRQELLGLANKNPHSRTGLLHAASLISRDTTPISLQDLVAFFIKQDPAVLLDKNPCLMKTDIEEIDKRVLSYLIMATLDQRIDRGILLIDEISQMEEGDRNLRVDELVDIVVPEVVYQPHEHPEYLAFEYLANIALRRDQVEKLSKLRQKEPVVAQMIMGSGKSKILGPLLAWLKADGEVLSVLVVPESLTETTAFDMQISQGQIFNQRVRRIDITRASDFSAENLRRIYDDLERMIVDRQCLIITSKSVACICLQFETLIYEYLQHGAEGPVPENLFWLQKILLLFRERSSVLMDEVDQLLFSRLEVNFPLDAGAAIQLERLECVEDLYHCLVDMTDLLQACTQDAFVQAKPSLARAVLERNKVLKAYIEQQPDQEAVREKMGRYICEDADKVETKDPVCNSLLAILKGELSVVLPLTLNKQSDTSYGLSKKYLQKVLAIPYASNNTPVESSDFGVLYELLNYTMQAYLLKGIPLRFVSSVVHALQSDVLNVIRRSSKTRLEDIPAYKELVDLAGGEVCIGDDTLAEKISRRLHDNIHLRISYIRRYIFPHAKISEQKVSVTAPGLVALFHLVQAFTGTPWNKDTYPDHLRSATFVEPGTDGKTLSLIWKHSDPEVKVVKDPSLDAQIQVLSEIVAKDPQCRALIDVGSSFHGIDNEDVAVRILDVLPRTILGVVFYRGDTPMVLERGSTKIVPLNESSLKNSASERFTYYDQRHTTGADILQACVSSAAVVLGKSVILRDYLQSVWRMRGLGRGQRLHHVMTNELVDMLIGRFGSIGLRQSLCYFAEGQFQQENDHALLSVTQKRDEVLKQHVLHKLLHSELSPEFLKSQGEAITAFLLRSTKDVPEEVYGARDCLISSEEFRTRKLQEVLPVVQRIAPMDADELLAAIRLQVEGTPIQKKGIRVSSLLEGQEVESEQESQKEQEMHEEKQVGEFITVSFRPTQKRFSTPEFEFMAKEYSYVPRPDVTSPDVSEEEDAADKSEGEGATKESPSSFDPYCFCIGHGADRGGDVREEASLGTYDEPVVPSENSSVYTVNSLVGADSQCLFSKNLLLSLDALRMTDGQTGGYEKFTLFDALMHPFEYLMAIRDQAGTIKVRILRSGEFFEYFKQFQQWDTPSLESSVALYSLKTGPLHHIGKGAGDLARDPRFLQMVVQAKFLNGETEYAEEEIQYLREWLQGREKEYKEFFLAKVTKFSPEKRKDFAQTSLGRLLAT